MRKCPNVVRLLAEFLEGQLPADVHGELERHLSACPRCLAQLKTYRSTVSLLRSLQEDELPAELRLTLRSFLQKNCHN